MAELRCPGSLVFYYHGVICVFQYANGRIKMSYQPLYFIIMVSSMYFSMTVAELRFPVGLCILVSLCHPCRDNSRIKMSCQPVYFGIMV